MTLFRVDGVPVPKGSGRAIVSRSTGRGIFVPDSRDALRTWTESIQVAAKLALDGPLAGPVWLGLWFMLARPKRLTRPLPSVRPDADKLARAALDALTGIAYEDDAQVTTLFVSKQYADREPHAMVLVRADTGDDDG